MLFLYRVTTKVIIYDKTRIKFIKKYGKNGRRIRYTKRKLMEGLALIGSCGTGKTSFLYAIEEIMGGYLNGVSLIKSTDIPTLAKRDDWIWFLKRKLLLVDDVGNERNVKNYGEQLSPIKDIIEYRYNADLPTIITSNYSIKTIGEMYGERVADRLKDYMPNSR